MTPTNFDKLKTQIYFPDYAYKFLLSNRLAIPTFKEFNLIFKYTSTSYDTFSPLAMKTIFILESIYPRKVSAKTRCVVLKFTDTRPHTEMWIKMNFDEFMSFMPFFAKRPAKQEIFSNLRQDKYFVFPGHSPLFFFPTWSRTVTLSYEKNMESNPFLFHKSAFID